MGTKIKFDR